jgi:ferredoxin-type protein NapH
MMKLSFKSFLPLLIGSGIALIVYSAVGWWGFLFLGSWVGGWITVGVLLASSQKGLKRDLGRRIAILVIGLTLMIFLGVIEHENLQIEENIFYLAYFLSGGAFTRVLIHYSVAKVFGPLLFRRGFCGWACWTAGILDWLPMKSNDTIPKRWTYLRWPVLVASLLIPFVLLWTGYDYMTLHIDKAYGKWGQFRWFVISNALYFMGAIALAYLFHKKRAFCLVLCPVSLVMKLPSFIGRIRREPSGEKCTECGECNRVCLMDIDVMGYIVRGEKINSTECILCSRCKNVCPVNAIA